MGRVKESGRLGYVEFGAGERVDIRAGVYTLGGYSAHAGQRDLVNFVKRMRVRPGVVRIVHGDDGAKLALKGLLEGLGCGVLIPGS